MFLVSQIFYRTECLVLGEFSFLDGGGDVGSLDIPKGRQLVHIDLNVSGWTRTQEDPVLQPNHP